MAADRPYATCPKAIKMTDTARAKPAKPKPKEKHRPANETAFVVSSAGGVFEHVADDLEDEDSDSVYLRDVQHD